MINSKQDILTLCFLMLVLILSGCQSKTDEVQTDPIAEKEIPAIEENVISVSTTEQFLSAIGPDRTIKVASGEYDLLSIKIDNEYIKYEDTYDGRELVIYKVENLKIIGDENSKPEFVIDPRYSNVMVFKEVGNLTIKNIVAGHRKDLGESTGGVFKFDFSDDVVLENLDLYGSGTVGIDIKDSRKFRIINPNIYEFSYSAMIIENSSDIEVVGGNIHDNTVFEALIRVKNSTQIVFNETTFDNNNSIESDGYVSYEYFVMNESDTPINFNNCVITNNDLEYFYFKKDNYSNTLVKGNSFIVDTDENDLYNNSYAMHDQSWYEVKIKESTDWLGAVNVSNTKLVKNKSIAKYTKLIEDLDVLDLNGIPTALTSFKEMSKIIDNTEISDELFAIFLDYYTKYMDVASYSMYSYTELGEIYNGKNPSGFVDLSKIKDQNLKLKVESSISSGIKLDVFYDNIYTSELEGFVISKVEAYVSEGMRKYLELREEERYNQSYEYDELGMNIEYNYREIDRLVKWEKFYIDYPKFLKNDKFINYIKVYEFILKQPFENIEREIVDENLYKQNYSYM
ncbi:MAG: right-handed parallel beta-helix repeat-containing protein, partial [Acidaminobacteraceae bacterium]